MKSTLWSHRGVQLDLARQYERPDQIRQFISLAASWGFTHVYLYLEGRIRTASFPYPDPATSYDVPTIQRIVRHATQVGVELIPIVPSFGHVEQFIKHEALAYLAEVPAGGEGRFGKSHGTCACPSNPATFEFFSTYYCEIANIFPSPYFHIGMDEAFDVGLCPRCKRAGLDALFANYVKRITRFVEDDLGRTVLMWDDMLEACPNAIDQIPKSIILFVWLYDEVFDKPWSRFFNRTRSDLIPFYARHDFQTIAACRDVSLLNVDSVTEHGRTSPFCIGGLVTSWEHSSDFIQQYHPIMAYAAQRWAEPSVNATAILLQFFGKVAPDVLEALKQLLSRRTWIRHTDLAGHSRGLPTLQDHERRLATDHIQATLNSKARRSIKPSAWPTWDCIQMDLEFESIHHTLSNLIPRMTLEVGRHLRPVPSSLGEVGDDPTDKKELLAAAIRLKNLARRHRYFWNKVRRGIPIGPLPSALEAFAKEIRAFARTPSTKKHWLVRIHGFLPDRFGVPIIDVAIQLSGSKTWRTIHHGSIKTFWDEQPYYEYWIKTRNWTKTPTAIRIQVSGHGGHGFRYVEIETPNGRYIPTRILSTKGIVEHPVNILVDDKRWMWLGVESVRDAYDNPKQTTKLHGLALALMPHI